MAFEAVPWNLTIASDLRLLSLTRAFVEGVCLVAGFDEPFTHAVVLATDEATNNVMRHAHQGNPDAPIQIQCRLLSREKGDCPPEERGLSPFSRIDGIEIRLIDEGEPFDLEAVPHLDPAELRVGGRGVFLMRRLMDELSCHANGCRGNTLRMLKRCRRIPRDARRV